LALPETDTKTKLNPYPFEIRKGCIQLRSEVCVVFFWGLGIANAVIDPNSIQHQCHFCPGIRFNNTSIATCWHGQKWDGDASYCISLNKLALKVSKNIQHTWLAKIGI